MLPGSLFQQQHYRNFQHYTDQALCFIYATFHLVKIRINYVTYIHVCVSTRNQPNMKRSDVHIRV
jgi:hypothetical protein